MRFKIFGRVYGKWGKRQWKRFKMKIYNIIDSYKEVGEV